MRFLKMRTILCATSRVRSVSYTHLDVYKRQIQADESYTSHNTERLDVAGTIAKIKTAEYVQLALEGREHEAVQ